jgi:hypothetical protein
MSCSCAVSTTCAGVLVFRVSSDFCGCCLRGGDDRSNDWCRVDSIGPRSEWMAGWPYGRLLGWIATSEVDPGLDMHATPQCGKCQPVRQFGSRLLYAAASQHLVFEPSTPSCGCLQNRPFLIRCHLGRSSGEHGICFFLWYLDASSKLRSDTFALTARRNIAVDNLLASQWVSALHRQLRKLVR